MSSRARRRLGQNFLVDRRAVRRIVEALGAGPDDRVLEIGPGRGALTGELVRAAGRIAAIELDERLADALEARFSAEQLLLLRGDVLRADLRSLAQDLGRAGEWMVAGNLPYSISKPVALQLVRDRLLVRRAVLMFQREVAQRLTAEPGTRSYGPLGVLAGEAFSITRLFDLPPSAFRPAPRVSSSVTLWQRAPAALTREDEARLRACLAACFARRRRTLRNNLRVALTSDAEAEDLLRLADLDGGARAEAIAPAGFRRLAALWPPRAD